MDENVFGRHSDLFQDQVGGLDWIFGICDRSFHYEAIRPSIEGGSCRPTLGPEAWRYDNRFADCRAHEPNLFRPKGPQRNNLYINVYCHYTKPTWTGFSMIIMQHSY